MGGSLLSGVLVTAPVRRRAGWRVHRWTSELRASLRPNRTKKRWISPCAIPAASRGGGLHRPGANALPRWSPAV